jgi:Flp pilus assembly protein protease CpaA
MAFIEMYGFLMFLGIVWAFIAGLQDMKTTFVANWLTYSLVIFGLAYRFFYGFSNGKMEFFYYGLLGFCVFFVLAHLFYYAKVFGGGDAKLLIGFGVVLPYDSLAGIGNTSLSFFTLFFIVGAAYSLVYGGFLAHKHWSKFKEEFEGNWKEWIKLFVPLIIFSGVLFFADKSIIALFALLLTFLTVLYPAVKALEKSMIVLKSPNKLLEGDWMHDDFVKFSRGKVINKSVHGLSLREIKMLKRAKKSVRIKEGIPFVPVFFLTLATVYVLEVLSLSLF